MYEKHERASKNSNSPKAPACFHVKCAGVKYSGENPNISVYGQSINVLALRGLKVPWERHEIWAYELFQELLTNSYSYIELFEC